MPGVTNQVALEATPLEEANAATKPQTSGCKAWRCCSSRSLAPSVFIAYPTHAADGPAQRPLAQGCAMCCVPDGGMLSKGGIRMCFELGLERSLMLAGDGRLRPWR